MLIVAFSAWLRLLYSYAQTNATQHNYTSGLRKDSGADRNSPGKFNEFSIADLTFMVQTQVKRSQKSHEAEVSCSKPDSADFGKLPKNSLAFTVNWQFVLL